MGRNPSAEPEVAERGKQSTGEVSGGLQLDRQQGLKQRFKLHLSCFTQNWARTRVASEQDKLITGIRELIEIKDHVQHVRK